MAKHLNDRCANCGKKIGPDPSYETCPGEVYMAPNPFAEEIYDDHTDYEDCDGNRFESAMDV